MRAIRLSPFAFEVGRVGPAGGAVTGGTGARCQPRAGVAQRCRAANQRQHVAKLQRGVTMRHDHLAVATQPDHQCVPGKLYLTQRTIGQCRVAQWYIEQFDVVATLAHHAEGGGEVEGALQAQRGRHHRLHHTHAE